MPDAAAAPPTWTVKALLTWTTQYLGEKGVESPRLDAQVLLAHVMKVPKIELMVRFHDEPTPAERAEFKQLIQRRVEHWPVAYLTGRKEFYLLPFEVSPAVLVPRPDTETLVLKALELLKLNPAGRVLDVGTGSGCIAVSVAHQAKACSVTATDVSPDALAIAARNAAATGVEARVRFLKGDLFAAVPAGETFDVILSNPPYVTTAEWAELAPEVRDHEPRGALDGGPDGLNFYRRIAADAGQYLTPGGTVAVEIGHTQGAPVSALLAAAGYSVGKVIRDAAGRPRVVAAKKL